MKTALEFKDGKKSHRRIDFSFSVVGHGLMTISTMWIPHIERNPSQYVQAGATGERAEEQSEQGEV